MEHKQPEAGEARFRNLVEKNADGVLVIREDGGIAFANPAAAALFGRRPADLVGTLFGTPLVPGETAEVDLFHGRDLGLESIFEPFTQVNQSLERTQGGLGLGLALVRRLVELHGGSVSAHSEGPGRGSEFVVRLPLLARPADPKSAAGPAQAPPRRILLVEDSSDGREMLADLLRLGGHVVEEAADGLEGLARVRANPPDVALIDIGLPGLDGYRVAQEVRALPGGEKILLVAVTGYGQPEDRRRARAAGFDAHLVKPVDLDELSRLLA